MGLREGGDERRVHAKLALASASAAVAEAATFPIDLIKTRLQLHQGLDGRPAGWKVLRVAGEIRREGGFLGFYRGLSPAVLRHLFYTPIRIVAYEHLRDAHNSPLVKALAGGVSGVLAQVVASPADLIKVRMQADGRLLSQHLQPRYAGIYDAFSKIIQIEGFLGLWRGVYPNAQRAFLVNMGELACYDNVKRFIISKQICGDNIYAHTLASVASGLSATALSCPADVVKTRMMNQDSVKGTRTVYRNSCDCFVKTVKFEGIMALWKGFFPTWARLGPWQFVFWVSYEKFRQGPQLRTPGRVITSRGDGCNGIEGPKHPSEYVSLHVEGDLLEDGAVLVQRVGSASLNAWFGLHCAHPSLVLSSPITTLSVESYC